MDTAYAASPTRSCVVSFMADEAAKLAIVNAVDEPIATIKVQHICDRCGISRGTFYNHFHSKYDMRPWFLETVMQKTLDRIGRDLTWEEGVATFFEVAGAAERFNRMTAMGPEASVAAHRRRVIIATLESYRGVRPTKEQRLLIEHYVDCEARLCSRWCAGELPGDARVVRELFVASVPPWLYGAMEGDGCQRARCCA